jgi:hypothetical protein
MTEQNVAVARPGYSPILLRAEQIGAALHNPVFALALNRTIALTILLALAVILVATAWLSGVLMRGMIGGPSTFLAVLGPAACAVALSRRTGQGFVSSLIFVGFGGFTLLFAALYVVAGYALILGG